MERGKLGWTTCRCLRVLRGFWFTAKFAKEVRKGRQERERSIASYFCSAVMSASRRTPERCSANRIAQPTNPAA
mgnify:CR=1 FL=1